MIRGGPTCSELGCGREVVELSPCWHSTVVRWACRNLPQGQSAKVSRLLEYRTGEQSFKWRQADREPRRELDRSAEDKTYDIKNRPGATLVRLLPGDHDQRMWGVESEVAEIIAAIDIG